MIKKLRIYQISLIAVSMLCIGLLAFMGITAIQKSLRLNLSFQSNPEIKVQLEIYNTNESKWETVFQNDENAKIKNGVTLNGNSLGFRSEYAKGLGNEFTLKVTSLTNTPIIAEFSGASYDKSSLVFENTSSEPQQVIVSAVTGLNIDFTKLVSVFITDNSNGGLTLSSSSNFISVDSKYYAKLGKELSISYNLSASYQNPSITATIGTSQVATATTSITIPANSMTGNVALVLSAEPPSEYQMTFNITYTGTTSLVSSGNQYLYVLFTNDTQFNLLYIDSADLGATVVGAGWYSANINNGSIYSFGFNRIGYNGNTLTGVKKLPTDFDNENYILYKLSDNEYNTSGSNLIQNLKFNVSAGWRVFIFSNCGYAAIDKQLYLQKITNKSESIGVVTNILADHNTVIGGIEFVMPNGNASMDLTFYAIDTD